MDMPKTSSTSRSVACKQGATLVGGSHILVVALLFLPCLIGIATAQEIEVPLGIGDLALPLFNESLVVSKEKFSRAMKLAETEGLKMLRRFVGKDESYAKRLGYESLSQLADEKQLVPLVPFPVFKIGLTQLQNYDGNIAALFTRRHAIHLVVPIAVSGQSGGNQKPPLSAITVRLDDARKSEKIIEWGLRNTIKHLATRRNEIIMNKEKTGAPLFVMEIQALNRLYLGYKKQPSESIMLIPISGVRPSERISEQPIDEVLKGLVQEARIIDKTPR
jgi:hypothetical protein